ncbi:MAG TPA: hypothetical protein VFM45_05915 [Anaeromyxobacteraceae bacterium]|nr:hypothetical protein [Anaeromyxobacteraceae bacterium]
MKPIPVAVAAVALLSLQACSTTRLTDTWRDPGYATRPVSRILVIGVLVHDDRPDPSFENALAAALTRDGYKVVTSSMAFSPMDLETDRIEKYVRDHRIDLVVQMRIAPRVSSSYTPPASAYVGLPTNVPTGWNGGWYGGWYAPGMLVTVPGRVTEGSSVEAEIKAFSLATESMVWSAASSTENVVGDKDAARSLAAEVVRDLEKAGILSR